MFFVEILKFFKCFAGTLESGEYYLAKYTYFDGTLTVEVENDGYPIMSQRFLGSIRIFGLQREPLKSPTLRKKDHGVLIAEDILRSIWDSSTNVLNIKLSSMPMNVPFSLQI
jgi:hypothetical protein